MGIYFKVSQLHVAQGLLVSGAGRRQRRGKPSEYPGMLQVANTEQRRVVLSNHYCTTYPYVLVHCTSSRAVGYVALRTLRGPSFVATTSTITIIPLFSRLNERAREPHHTHAGIPARRLAGPKG